MCIYLDHPRAANKKQSAKGASRFWAFNINVTSFAPIIKAHDPPFRNQAVYRYMADRIKAIVEEAIALRGQY